MLIKLVNKKKPYGSGYFGEWIQDRFGLPAYRYSCNQTIDSKAITPMNKEWRSKTEHLHQVGNDRLVAVASNYGYVQVRQDEGGPKYLNEFDPERGYFAGGIGYLTDGKDVMSTYYTGEESEFERIFGIGYFQKKIKGTAYSIDQVILAPFGDDPLLISQATITNHLDKPADIRWIEYWGCRMYQFTINAYIKGTLGENEDHPRKIRHDFSDTFYDSFEAILKGNGLKNIKILTEVDETELKSYKVPTFEDLNPPSTFLVSLDAPPNSMGTNLTKFLGTGNVQSPEGIMKDLQFNEIESKTNTGMLLERKIHLNAKESKTIYFAYGYLPDGFELNDLLDYYFKNTMKLWDISSNNWKSSFLEFNVPSEPWIQREIKWHNYYLRGTLTYDDYFQEHILSQGHVYQYIIGFQGASRDPLQHVFPFIYIEPEIVKNVIRYTLKTIQKDGEIPYGITGNGKIMPAPFIPSDLELWLLWLTSEYVLATRDEEFLHEKITTYPVYGPNAEETTVLDLLALSYNHFLNKTGIGKHGIQKLSNGDWNDSVIIGHIPREKQRSVKRHAESVLNAAMTIVVFRKYAEMLTYLKDFNLANEFIAHSNSQKEAVHAQWVGRWFRRAWLNEELGWIGEDQMWLEPQPWAIIGGAVSKDQIPILIQSINELVRDTSKIGARLHSKGIDVIRNKGQGTNGGVWPSINGTLIWALSLVNKELAWDEYKKNMLATHAEYYPEIWYGIWSGPDCYNSELSNYPGQTVFDERLLEKSQKKEEGEESPGHINVSWTDFPVFNLHPHAWPLFNITHLIGVNFTKDGIEFTPSLPKDEFRFTSSLLGFTRTKEGFSGWYAPLKEGTWKFALTLDKDEILQLKTLEINGRIEEFSVKDTTITWNGKNEAQQPIYWKIKL